MKIGMMAPPWMSVPPAGYGGTESVVDRLVRGLADAGHEVMLWTTGDSTCPVTKGWVFDRAQIDALGLATVELRHLIKGYHALSEWGADLVHDHTVIGPVYSHRFEDLQVVTTNHGPFNIELNDLYREIHREVPIIAISHDQASRAGDIDIAAVIHHGIDVDDFPVGDGAGDDQGPYHLFLGRMAPEKGARRAALIARHTGIRLKIAAKMREPLEIQFFRERVEPLLDERIVYVGEASFQQKIELLRGATSLINPIRWPEPFGLVMIEALAVGTPVLTYCEGSAPELIDDGVTGFLCENRSHLMQRLDEVASIERAACRRAVLEGFSTQRMVQHHLEVYRQTLEVPR